MSFKKIDDVGRILKTLKEELEYEDINVEVENLDEELHNQNEVKEESQNAEESKETINDYLLARGC